MLESALSAIANNPWQFGISLSAALAAGVGYAWHRADPDAAAKHRREPLTSPRKNQPMPATYVSLDGPPVDEYGRSAYEQLGPTAIRTATDQFYNGVQNNPRLIPYFRADRMEYLKRHLPLMIGQLLGGPVQYTDPLATLREQHANLRISPEAYSALIADLNTIFYRLQVPSDIRIFLLAKLIQVENLVICQELQTRPHRIQGGAPQ